MVTTRSPFSPIFYAFCIVFAHIFGEVAVSIKLGPVYVPLFLADFSVLETFARERRRLARIVLTGVYRFPPVIGNARPDLAGQE